MAIQKKIPEKRKIRHRLPRLPLTSQSNRPRISEKAAELQDPPRKPAAGFPIVGIVLSGTGSDGTMGLRSIKGEGGMVMVQILKKITKRLGKAIEFIPEGVMSALQSYHWPGNIRELEKVLERAAINSSGPKLHLSEELKKPVKDAVSIGLKTMEAFERNHILQVLEKTDWKISGKDSASEILGLERSTLRARMTMLKIKKP